MGKIINQIYWLCLVIDATNATYSQNGYYTESVTVTWQGNDGGSDGSGIGSCDDPTTYSGPDGKSIELTGACTDYAGNTGQGTFTLSYDGTGPEVTITKAEDGVDDVANGGTTKSNQIEFRFTASDSASWLQSVQCRLESGSFSDCTSPVEYTKLKKGTHAFEVRAIDQVGHLSTDDFKWTIEPQQQQRQQQQQKEATAATTEEGEDTSTTTVEEEEEEGTAEQGREGGGADRGSGTDDGSGDQPKR